MWYVLGFVVALAAAAYALRPDEGPAPTENLMMHPEPEIPDNPMVAPVYGHDPVFPDTNYLVDIPTVNWTRANDLSAIFRNNQRYSIKSFIRPDQVPVGELVNVPIEEAICRMYLTTLSVPYVSDVGVWDYWKYPSETLLEGGDCEDTSILFASMLKNRDIDCYVVAGMFMGDIAYGHSWVVIRIPEKGEFLFETALDYQPSSFWNEVHNSPISQYYVPCIYWNMQEVFIAKSRYKEILYGPAITADPQQEDEQGKVQNIRDMWRMLG
jgi:hypothetical protein